MSHYRGQSAVDSALCAWKMEAARGFMSLKFWSVAASNGVSYVQQPFPIPHDGGSSLVLPSHRTLFSCSGCGQRLVLSVPSSSL